MARSRDYSRTRQQESRNSENMFSLGYLWGCRLTCVLFVILYVAGQGAPVMKYSLGFHEMKWRIASVAWGVRVCRSGDDTLSS